MPMDSIEDGGNHGEKTEAVYSEEKLAMLRKHLVEGVAV
jgi:hypothetical protein